MTLSEFILFSASLTIMLSAYLFGWQYIRKDGIARLMFLIFAATFFVGGVIRLATQIARVYDWINPHQASYITAFNVSIMQILPLVVILSIILFYRFKK